MPYCVPPPTLFVAAFAGAILCGCFDFTREPYGSAGEQCYIEGTCDDGLVCDGDVCVEACGPKACGGNGLCSFQEQVEVCTCYPGFVLIDGSCVGASTVRVVNGARDLAGIDVYLAGAREVAIADLGFGEAGLIQNLGPGNYALELRQVGLPQGSSPLFASPAFTILAGASYDAVLSGTQTAGPGERSLTLRTYARGAPGLRFVHAADSVIVDVVIDGLLQLEDHQPLAEGTPVVTAGRPTELLVLASSNSEPLVEATIAASSLPSGAALLLVRAPDTAETDYDVLLVPPLPSTDTVVLPNAIAAIEPE